MKYMFLANLLLQFLYYRKRNKKHGETVVSMLPCGALERSNNLYIESIVKPCVSRIKKGSLLCGFDWKEKPAMEKIIP